MILMVCEVEAYHVPIWYCLVSPVGAFALTKPALEADSNGSADAALAARHTHRPRHPAGRPSELASALQYPNTLQKLEIASVGRYFHFL